MTTAMVLFVSWLTKRPDFRGFTGRCASELSFGRSAGWQGRRRNAV